MEKDLQFAQKQSTTKRQPLLGRCAIEYDEGYGDDELESADHEDNLAEAKYSVATSKSHTNRTGTKKPPRKPPAPAVPEYDWPSTGPAAFDRYDTFRGEKGHLPPGCVICFNNQVFERVFPRLGKRPTERDTEAFYSFPPRRVIPRMNKPHLQIVYAVLYGACYRNRQKIARLSDMDVSRRTGIDWRTVQRDIHWLTESGDIEMVSEGYSKARRSDGKTVWSVPLANFDTKEQYFTPVPKFVVDHYVPASPRAILLPVLQYVRQWRRYDGYWLQRVQDTTGWPLRTIYRAFGVLADQHKWGGKKDTDPDVVYHLPCPVEVREQRFNLRYLDFKGFKGRSPHLVPEFAEEFGLNVHRGYRFC